MGLAKFQKEAFRNNDNAIHRRFPALCRNVAEVISRADVTVAPYQLPITPIFCALPSEKKFEIICDIERYLSILLETYMGGHDLKESKQLSWNAFKKLAIKPNSNFFTYIRGNSVVEIYTADGIQVFRNLRFFEVCSYTLEDIYCRPWFELYGRAQHINDLINFHIKKLLTGRERQPYCPEIGKHYLTENLSPFRYKVLLEIEILSPVSDEKGDIGKYFSAIETAEVVTRLNVNQKSQMLKNFYSNTKIRDVKSLD